MKWRPMRTAPQDDTPIFVGWKNAPTAHIVLVRRSPVRHWKDAEWCRLDGALVMQPDGWFPVPEWGPRT